MTPAPSKPGVSFDAVDNFPVQYVPGWDATATGSGLAQGAAAVAATP